MNDNPLIYLASPYSDPSPALRERRFDIVVNITSQLLASGRLVVSPIAHSHLIATRHGAGVGWEHWRELDTALIRACDELWVLKLPGWDISKGVRAEMTLARQFGKPVAYIVANDITPWYGVE